MREKDAAQAITAALWRAMLDRGPGTIKRTEKAIGLYQDGLRGTKNSKYGLRLHHVTEAIKALGIPPSVFFNDTFSGVSTTAAERFMARGAELAARKVVELPELADDIKPDRLTEDDLARLDAARFEDPRAAAEQAAGIARLAARDGRRGDTAAAVARQGSALRVAEEWEPAWVCVWWALRHAPDGPIMADSVGRAAYVLSDFGKFGDAAEISEWAAIKSMQLGNAAAVGRALVDQGIFLHRDDAVGDAAASLHASLSFLPESDQKNRFSAHLCLGLVHVTTGDIDSATFNEAQAVTFAESLPQQARTHLQWLRARIAAKAEDHSTAILIYRELVCALETAPSNAALATAELCRVYLNAGHQEKAILEAKRIVRFTIPTTQNPIVAATIVDIFCSVQEGLFTLTLIEKSIKSMQHAIWRRATGDNRHAATAS